MAVPAHDERDWEFAKQFGLPIVEVLEGGNVEEAAYTEDGPHVNSDFLNGLNKEEAIAKIVAWLEEKGFGQEKITYRLRDWLFSRQRYWGEPIPIIHWEDGTSTAVPESELPLVLPVTKDIRPSGTGESPLANLTDWLEVTREDGVKGRRETNTMPQWAGSSWYYLRYIDPHNTEKLADEDLLKQWLPVDIYVGGAEHAVLHLLYARFWHKFLYDLGVVPTKEPFQKLFNQGMILGTSYRDHRGALVATDKLKNVMVPSSMWKQEKSWSKHQPRCLNPSRTWLTQTMWWNNMVLIPFVSMKCSWDHSMLLSLGQKKAWREVVNSLIVFTV